MKTLRTTFTPMTGGRHEIPKGQKQDRCWHIIINANYTERDIAILESFTRSFMQCNYHKQEIEDGQTD